jgi:molybdopterin-guanine dinucleotide biosynthesis protein A
LDVDLGGQTVLERAVRTLADVVDEVIVVGRQHSSPTVAGASPGVAGARSVEDREPFGGPLAGLLVGLEAARGEVVLVAGGDMPLLRTGVLRLLLQRLYAWPTAAGSLLLVGGGLQPLPLALRREPAREAAAACLAAGNRSMMEFVGRLAIEAVPEVEWRTVDPDGDTLRDIDTAEDLEAVRERL